MFALFKVVKELLGFEEKKDLLEIFGKKISGQFVWFRMHSSVVEADMNFGCFENLFSEKQ